MRLDQLRYFVQIVDCKSINKAAQTLYISQPALTNAIKALEAELSIPLLTRTSKGVTTTKLGKLIYDDCKNLLGELDTKIELWKTLSDNAKTNSMVNIVTIPAMCTYISEILIPNIQCLFPHIKIMHHETSMDAIPQFLLENKNFIALTALGDEIKNTEFWKLKEKNFSIIPLLDDEYSIFLSTKNPLAKKSRLTIEDCQQKPLATYPFNEVEQGSMGEILFSKTQVKNFYLISGRENIMQMIVQDKAIGIFLKKISYTNWFIKHKLICSKQIENIHLLPSTHYLIYHEKEKNNQLKQEVKQYIITNYANTLNNLKP